MLTLSTIKSALNAAKYYSKEDNYYLSEADAKDNSLWWGKGAVELGLKGKVEEEDLKKLLGGELPNGVTIGLQKDGTKNHRPGYDLCFQAPKSVSILSLVGGDQRFYDAHLAAVKETLQLIERDAAQAKIFKDGKPRFENTKNLAVALVRHITSRELDPHLHHHALIMNCTKRSDNKWRALASSRLGSNQNQNQTINGFSERVYNNQIYYGLIYRNYLANKVLDLGYEIEMVGRHGMWEIKGVPNQARDMLSKRRKQIEEQLNKLNYNSFKAADIVTLDTREKKSAKINFTEIKKIWQTELDSLGFSPAKFIYKMDELKSRPASKSEHVPFKAQEALKDAIEHLSCYNFKLDYTKIMTQALEFAIGNTTHGELVSALNQMIQDGHLISLDKSDTAFVTQELIEKEKIIMDYIERGKGRGFVIKHKEVDGQLHRESEFNHGKESSPSYAVDILKSKDRLILVECKRASWQELSNLSAANFSHALSNSSVQSMPDQSNNQSNEQLDNTNSLNGGHEINNLSLITEVLKIAESAGKRVRVLSPSRLVTNDLNDNLNRNFRKKPNNLWQWLVSLGRPDIGETVSGFLYNYQRETSLPSLLMPFKQEKELIIVDGAEALGVKETEMLLSLTDKTKAKVLFLQDRLFNFGAYNSIATLKQAGIRVFNLFESKQDKKLSKNSTLNLISGLSPDINSTPKTPSLNSPSFKLNAIKDDSERTKVVAREFVRMQDKSIVLVGSNRQLSATNSAIRKELRNQGKLSNVEDNLSVLTPIYLSRPESTLAHRYQQNMVLRIYNHSYLSGDWNVDSYDRETNRLRLVQNKNKNRITINLKNKKQKLDYALFKRETISIAEGDKLISTSNMKELGIKNASRFIVTKLDDKYVELSPLDEVINNDKSGKLAGTSKTVKLKISELKDSHFQYSYATTIGRPLNNQADHIITDFKSYSLHKPIFSYLMDKAKESLTIFTDDEVIATRKLGYIPSKPTVAEMVLNNSHEDNFKSGSDLGTNANLISNPNPNPNPNHNPQPNTVNRLITNKTVTELKADIERAVSALRQEYLIREKAENRAVEFALEKITSRNAGFTHKDLVAAALEYTIKEQAYAQNQPVTREQIEQVIKEKRASGELVMGKYFDDGTRWTTKEILNLEQSIIDDLKEGLGKVEPFLTSEKAKSLLEKSELTAGQKEASNLILTTNDKYVVIQGYAGVGKTTLFSQVQSILQKEEREASVTSSNHVSMELPPQPKIEILALAPTHKAVKELINVGINAQTLASFLVEQRQLDKTRLSAKNNISNDGVLDKNKNPHDLDNKLIILDEVSMVSNRAFADLSATVKNSNARVVLSGDVAQHLAISSGKIFEVIQKSNILKRVYLREIVRQSNPKLKESVENIIGGNYDLAFNQIEKENPQNYIARIDQVVTESGKGTHQLADLEFFRNLKKSIVEIDNNKLETRVSGQEKTLEETLVDDYLTRTPKVRDNTAVIVHANKDRKLINELIREGLKREGTIAKDGVYSNCLTAKGLTKSECKVLHSYQEEDLLKFSGNYYRVVEVDRKSKSLLLQDESGKTRNFYPEKEVDKYNVELYSNAKKELAVGDTIRLTKTDKERGLFANFEYRVKAIDDNDIILDSRESKAFGKNKASITIKSDKTPNNYSKDQQGNKNHQNHQNNQNHQNHQSQIITLSRHLLRDAHWDYAYTVTGYGIQGGSKKYVIDFEVSYRKKLANKRSFYIGASRAIEHLIIYTDNKQMVLKAIMENNGDKYSALEISGRLDKIRESYGKNDLNNASTNSKGDIDSSVGNIKTKTSAITKTDGRTKRSLFNTQAYNLKELKESAISSAESIIKSLLGDPNSRLSSASEWRYGNKGSLVVNLAGAKRGLWYNFETGESGDLIKLLQKEMNLNFVEVLSYLSSSYGNIVINKNKSLFIEQDKKTIDDYTKDDLAKQKQFTESSSHSKTKKYAQKLVQESLPIAGTIVEKYLKDKRGIKQIDADNIRYHHKVFTGKGEKTKYLPAMLAIARDKDGNIKCVQVTYLDPKTADKANLDTKKRTYASPSGALVVLGKDDGLYKGAVKLRQDQKTTYIAEGIETALSIRDAVYGNGNGNGEITRSADGGGSNNGYKNSFTQVAEVVATLGKSNFATINPEALGKRIVFCLDNDGPKTFADSAIHKAAERLVGFGKEVFIAIPKSSEKNIKIDFNDVAKSAGIDEVSRYLNNSAPYAQFAKSSQNLKTSDQDRSLGRSCDVSSKERQSATVDVSASSKNYNKSNILSSINNQKAPNLDRLGLEI